jgi:hypothetical protein
VSAIQEVLPLDPKQPKYVRIVFESKYAVNMRGIAEFDTVEAASDWKRELTSLFTLIFSRAHSPTNLFQTPYSFIAIADVGLWTARTKRGIVVSG